MLRGSDVTGIAIIIPDESTNERTKNWILDTQASRLLGFLVTPGGWVGGARVILWEHIRSISSRSIQAAKISPIIEFSTIAEAKRSLEKPPRIMGLEVMTRQGKNLGQVSDFYFDETNGSLLGLETSFEPESETDSDRSFIPIFTSIEPADGVIVVTPETVVAMRENDTQKHYFDPEESAEAQLAKALGYRVTCDVRDGNEFIIAAVGQVVTDNVIDAARASGQEIPLLQSVGITPNH